MQSRLLGSFIPSREKAESLKKLRIIKQNLIHIHGLPKHLVDVEMLKSNEYFGQYGTIKNVVLSRKINPETGKEIYSVYITYENKTEAACAILCVDSLLIYGKIIRVVFGTTKFCNQFLLNKKCRKYEKCKFLHQLASNEDITIDANINFSYDEHLKLSKKIFEQSILNLNIKNNFLKRQENSKSVLPSIEYIFLSEEEKEKYFGPGNISYIRSNDNRIIDTTLKNKYIMFNNICDIYNKNNININHNNLIQKNGYKQSDVICKENIVNTKNFQGFNPKHNVDINKYQDPYELYNIFKDSITHILFSKPFYVNIRNAPLKKMEYNYFKNDLLQKGVDIHLLLGGCLDCIKDCI